MLRLNQLYEFVKSVVIEFYKDNGFLSASSLVYSTLMSLVPFLAVLTALFAAFGGIDILKANYADWFRLFDSPMQQKIIELIDQFVTNSRSLGVVGIISFLVTSIFLMNKIWAVFNSIFRSTSRRSQFKQFASYLTNLVLGTILISLSISISTLMETFLPHFSDIQQVHNLLFFFVPILIIFFVLFLLLKTIPATKVYYSSAAAGALFGTVFWQVVNAVFQNTSIFLTKNTTIYGSFAFLFIFLLWIYFLWVGILLSVEIAYVHQYGVYRTRNRKWDSPAYTVSLAAAVMRTVCLKYKEGNGICYFNEICSALKVPDRDASRIVALLENHRFLIRSDSLKWGYIPGRLIDDISAEAFVRTVFGEAPEEFCGTVADTLLENGIAAFKGKSVPESLF